MNTQEEEQWSLRNTEDGRQELYAKARNFKKKHKYVYVWVKNGKIFPRKTESAKTLLIRSENLDPRKPGLSLLTM